MDDTEVAHLAGFLDGTDCISVSVTRSDSYRTGFQFRPNIRLHIPRDATAIMGKLDEYCEGSSVNYSFKEKASPHNDTLVFELFRLGDIERFLRPMIPYLVVNYEQAMIMVETILPAVESGKHKSKEGLAELVRLAAPLRGPDPKYDYEFFQDEWDEAQSVEQ